MSRRGNNFIEFSSKVIDHIENYTVPQYGDAPDDPATGMTADDCAAQIAKYMIRYRKNQRGPIEQLRDMLKIAHYASLCYEKLTAEQKG